VLVSERILAILPELLIILLIGAVLLFDLIWSEEKKRGLGWLTSGGLSMILIASLILVKPGQNPQLVWGGMLRFDWFGTVFKILFIFGAAITALFTMDFKKLTRGEFYILMLVSTIGMSLMASSANLIMLYLAIETTSIPMYILAGFYKQDEKSTESGFKYLLFGAMTSAIMLYGFSLIYGFSGTANIQEIAAVIQTGSVSNVVVFSSLLLILVGFSFKISAFPFHFWAPDVYEGAPSPLVGFLSTASKAAGFAVLVRVLLTGFPALIENWQIVAAVISTLTMSVGNFVALTQKNIKRMLAYSSIAHAGYILIGVTAGSEFAFTSVILYLVVYLITNLKAFGIVSIVYKTINSDEIKDYAGLSRRSPGLALAMLISFLSLAGMPPFGGFISKTLLFAAAIKEGFVWLAFVGVLNAIVGVYYYLVVLKVVYLYRSENDEVPVPVSRPYVIGLTILSFGILIIGSFFSPWFHWSATAAAALF
jgi:NADH-quinone oxidoreductase subunit N